MPAKCRTWASRIQRNACGLELQRTLSGGVQVSWQRDAQGRPPASALRPGLQPTGGRPPAPLPLAGSRPAAGHRRQPAGRYPLCLRCARLPHQRNLFRRHRGVASGRCRGQLLPHREQTDRHYGKGRQLREANGIRYRYDEEGIEWSLVPFAMSEHGEYLAWDIAHRDANGELLIYVIGSRMGSIRYGAENLYLFVGKCMDKAAAKAMLGNGYQALPLIFEPITLAD